MDYSKKNWNEDFKKLRELFKKERTFDDAKKLFMFLHAMVHSSKISDINTVTFEDELWNGISERTFRESTNKKGRTVAYGMWHSARIEDITMSLLVTGKDEVMYEGKWLDKIRSSIYSTGNELDKSGILEFSKEIDQNSLMKYRNEVGARTRDIVANMTYSDSKRKVYKEGLDKALSLGAVAKDEEAIWLIDYWKKKTATGILLMPATRHNLVHINESIDAKNR